MMNEEAKGLLLSDREQAVEQLVSLLTSADKSDREVGYEMFREGLNVALYHSCLNYRPWSAGSRIR